MENIQTKVQKDKRTERTMLTAKFLFNKASQNTIFSQEDYSFNLRMVVVENKREFVYLNYK